MKTEFELEAAGINGEMEYGGTIQIIGTLPKYSPYVAIRAPTRQALYIKDKDLERFAVNILKALKSDKLK